MKSILCALLIVCLSCSAAQGQGRKAHGTVLEMVTKAAVRGAVVSILDPADSTRSTSALTDSTGMFVLQGVAPGRHLLKVSHVGYLPVEKWVVLEEPESDIGVLYLRTRVIEIGEVIVRESYPVTQKGDTTEYLAYAFGPSPGEKLEELLARLPGVTFRDGVLRVGGEQITKILIDGLPLFGPDMNEALGLLQAEDISRIQVYNQQSEQAEFSGFEDDETARVLGLVSRPEALARDRITAAGGFGERGRYTASASLMRMGGGHFYLASGSSSLSYDGRSGGGEVSPGGGEDVVRGPSVPASGNGASRMQSAWGSLQNAWSDLSLQSGYSFGHSNAEDASSTVRRYLHQAPSLGSYSQNSQSHSTGDNHRFTLRLEYTLDPGNSLLLKSRVSHNRQTASRDITSTTAWSDAAGYARIDSRTDPQSANSNVSGTLLWRHRFDLPGRTLSIDITTGRDRNNARSSYRLRNLSSQEDAIREETLDQSGQDTKDRIEVSAHLTYTEPLSLKSRFGLDYSGRLTSEASDRRVFTERSGMGPMPGPDPVSSGVMDQRYRSQRAGVGYQHQLGEVRLTGMLSYDATTMRAERTFPSIGTLERSYRTILPRVSLRYTGMQGAVLDVRYRVSPRLPSVTQLQDVMDNASSLFLRGGNPSLQQAVDHEVSGQCALRSESQLGFRARLSSRLTADNISTSTTVLERDSLTSSGMRLLRGTQITVPFNSGLAWRVAGGGGVEFPVFPGSLRAELSADGGWSVIPFKRNGMLYSSDRWEVRPMVDVTLTIGKPFRLSVDYGVRYQVPVRAAEPGAARSIVSHTARLIGRWSFLDRWELTYRGSLNHDPEIARAGGRQPILLNLAVKGKVFPDGKGEISLAVNDLLNPDLINTVQITDLYIEEISAPRFGRNIMLQFGYSWN